MENLSDRLCVAMCGLVVLGDVAQLFVKPLTPALFAPIGGALLYTGLGIGMVRRWRAARWVVLGMPVVPLAATAAWMLGASSHAPDRWMLGIAAVQLIAAGLAWNGR